VQRELTAEEKAKIQSKTTNSSVWKYEREKETSVKIKVKQVETQPR